MDIVSKHGGPSANSDCGLSIFKFSNCSGVSLFLSYTPKKPSSVAASPLSKKAYLVVLLELKYGKLRKFPVSSLDFNSTCLGKTSELPNPNTEPIEINLFLIKDASTGTVVNKKIDLSKVQCTMHAGHTNEIQLSDDIKLIMKYPTLKDIALAVSDSETEALFEMISNGISQIIDGETIHERVDTITFLRLQYAYTHNYLY